MDPNGNFWGLAVKLAKVALKGGDISLTLAGIVQDAKVLMDSSASVSDRAIAAASLASEVISPISLRDAKAVKKAVEGKPSIPEGASSIPTVSRATNRGEIPTTTAQTQTLRTNMSRDGMRFDPGEEAHHIVAKKDGRAARSRELLAEAGVDVNSPANGVPLPGTRTTPNPNNKAVHRGVVVHSDGCYRYVERELLDAPVAQRPTVIRRIAGELDRGEINWTD
jgi:hypothetical protein